MYRMKRPDNKEKGVLLPVFSLPSKYGMGCFSREAKEFIDWLKETGHTYWQILPLNPTGMADSPYQPLSSFAGNAYYIDPEQLMEQGLIAPEELEEFEFGGDPSRVEYETLYETRLRMLRLAHRRFTAQRQVMALQRAVLGITTLGESGGKPEGAAAGTSDNAVTDEGAAGAIDGTDSNAEYSEFRSDSIDPYERYLADNVSWLKEYALFMALREEYGKELSWDDWPDSLRCRDAKAVEEARETYAEDIDFYRWTQYEFYREWGDLKAYANRAGIKIFGDMPIYVSYDSADCWANPEMFQLDEDRKMTKIAGVPPDDFAGEGQLWGNPLYDWDKMKEDGYAWWISRIRQSFVLYDVIRLDHFRGYEAYYSCDADAINGRDGIWHKGPGMELFRQLEQVLGIDSVSDLFVAEDLGCLTEGVYQLLRETGFPGTKVLQFAFDNDPNNPYLTENYTENCVVYTGTHDNDTTAGWFRTLSGDAQAGILQYLGLSAEEAWKLVLEHDAYLKKRAAGAEGTADTAAPEDPAILATDLLIRRAMDSRAKIAIIPLQDYLHLGSEARTNTPGTIVNNWCWRMTALPGQI